MKFYSTLNNFFLCIVFFLFKGLPELNIDELENYLMSIEQQNDSQNIQSLTGLSAEEIAEEVDLFFASVNKQQTDSSNIQSLTGLSAEEIGEEVDLFFATSQPIFENDAAISNVCETPEIGESNVGKRPASPQATSSKCRLQECTSEYTSVRKMIFFFYTFEKKKKFSQT
jgi:predicted ATP-grasp superfamily ATP-dependent carboligase